MEAFQVQFGAIVRAKNRAAAKRITERVVQLLAEELDVDKTQVTADLEALES